MVKRKRIAAELAELVLAAETTKARAYAPYSRFRVGAALRTKSGRVYAACNVENRSYGLTVCAERNAIALAIAHGERSFEAIVIASDADPPAPPCGACREVLAEFRYDLPVFLIGKDESLHRYRLDALLPVHFEFSPKKRAR